MGILDLFRYARHNRRLKKEGKLNPKKVQRTTVGWRPDPWEEKDGLEKTKGPTPSGNTEYHECIRGCDD